MTAPEDNPVEKAMKKAIKKAMTIVGDRPGHREVVEEAIREVLPHALDGEARQRHARSKVGLKRWAKQYRAAAVRLELLLKKMPVEMKVMLLDDASDGSFEENLHDLMLTYIGTLDMYAQALEREGLGLPKPDAFAKRVVAQLALDTCRAIGTGATMDKEGEYRRLAGAYRDVAAVIAPGTVRGRDMERHCRAALTERRAHEAFAQHDREHGAVSLADP